MQIEDALRNLGLDIKEARVYRALSELGQSTAYAVAEKSGLKRPTVYVVLDELRMKGLVLKIPHAQKQLFIAKPPDELFAEAKERIRQAESALPELLAMLSGASKPKTLYFEGLDGIRRALRYGLSKFPEKELVGFYAHAGDASNELVQVFWEYSEEIKKAGVRSRGIVPEHESLKDFRAKDKEYGREMHVVPYTVYSANISIDMGEKFVRHLDFKNLQAVVIENEDIAHTMKQIFEMVWKYRQEISSGRGTAMR